MNEIAKKLKNIQESILIIKPKNEEIKDKDK